MQLSKLEIKGFKSFADKVIINFDQDITGIVGPNGCGKSNVIDAIRWVLGEQRTKNLRSEKMENIIFNGTRSRKQLQMAEVSLTFENNKNLLPTEYSQVTITRRYYRTGESEYLLNSVPCRLKDINNLFLDTGIGSDSYAIIELKMVDDILNDNNHSRRGLFEEAAGISKFKVRKKETLRKLEDTDADLERVEDLLFEIVKNLKTLEKQAKQAEKYYKTKDEYRRLSIELAKKVVSRQSESLLSLNEKAEAERTLKAALNDQMAGHEEDIDKLKASITDKEKLLASRQKTLNEHINKIRQYESDRKIKSERQKYLTDKRSSLEAQLEQERKTGERAALSLESLEGEKQNAEKLFAEAEQVLHELKDAYEKQKQQTQGVQAEVNALNGKIKARQDEVYRLKKDVEIKQVQYSALRQELEKAVSADSEQRASLAQFDEKIGELKEELYDREQELKQLTAEEEQRQKEMLACQEVIDSTKDRIGQLSRRLDALQNEYNLTKSLVDNLEGFPEAIKFLKKSGKWDKDVPLLSDVLTCDEKYRVAIENYLEPYMNYYIVENEQQAMQAVHLLNEAAKGKAHFFVLEHLEQFSPAPKQQFDTAVAAIDIAEFDSKYKNLVHYVLDRVYVVTERQEEIPQQGAQLNFITQNGKMIHRAFSISGGSVGLFEGKRIGRAKNLEKLTVQIAELKEQVGEAETVLKEKNALLQQLRVATKKEAINKLQREVAQVQQQLITVRTKQEQFHEMISNNALRSEDMQERLSMLKEEIIESEPKAGIAMQELKAMEEAYYQANEQMHSFNELLSQKSAAYNQHNIQYFQLRNKVESVVQEMSYKQNVLEGSQRRVAQHTGELKQVEEEIKKLLDTEEAGEEVLLDMYDEKVTIEAGVTEAEKDYYAAKERIGEVEKAMRELQRRREASDQAQMELQHKLNEARLQLTSVRDRLSVEFEVDLEFIMTEEGMTLSPLTEEYLREELKQTKDRLEKIGQINPMAMEAYNEIKERHDFIVSQKEDLLKAKGSLQQTISEIDAVAKDTFLQAFHQIRDNFIKVFRSLFSEEDTCDLTLAEPGNPLESRIEIMAKPKGKRPLTINQLSGGEKTLTATALLFSIYLLRPAPFCIFDEVDAPLDDANIDKFNNIIRKFSDMSQFIIVTHNKRTMASTDIMYGVTMIEQGVSRVVPVDLRTLA